ncbi:hypothetical protein BJY00DRAFT_292238 [Aspergillus carlsbadensis]|nr:hypothetical protein BJY00DRAFT_292238 [Aspergillus carlsbadensis]
MKSTSQFIFQKRYQSLPLSRILNPLPNLIQSILEPRSCTAQGIPDGFPSTSSGTVDGTPNAASRCAGDASDCPRDSADGVAERGGDELGGAGYALVGVVRPGVIGHFGWLWFGFGLGYNVSGFGGGEVCM